MVQCPQDSGVVFPLKHLNRDTAYVNDLSAGATVKTKTEHARQGLRIL